MAKKIERLEDLVPDSRNANKGTERGQYMVDESITQLGAGRSIVVDRDGNVIAGNKTLQAAVDAGLGVEVIRTDGKKLVVVQREDLDLYNGDGKARQLAYADNRAGEVGLSWDVEQVMADLSEGLDLGQWFKEDELEDLIKGGYYREDKGPVEPCGELCKKWGMELGQVWHLPSEAYPKKPHVLLCGDSLTDFEKVKPRGAYTLFCDPMFDDYIIEKIAEVYCLDHVVWMCGDKQLLSVLMACKEHFATGVFLGGRTIAQMGNPYRLHYAHKLIVWSSIKGLHFGKFSNSVLGTEEGGIHQISDVYHYFAKPVDVVEKMLKPFSQKVVVDNFAGLGSSWIAAERLRRHWVGIELDLNYCAAIVERCERLGLTPAKVG